MATVRELVTSWGFDIDEKPLKELDKSIKNIKSTLTHIGIAAGAAVAGIFGIVETTASAGEEAAKTAQKIGMQTGALQELQYAAHMADVDQGELTIGLKFLSSNMYDASKGTGEAGKKFSALGIQFKSTDGKLRPVNDTLMSIADKFAVMPDGAEKTAMAVDLFGRSGINMIPLLNKGSASIAQISAEARKFGLVLDESAIKQGEEFMDGMKRLKGALGGIKNEIGTALLPAINDLMGKMLDWISANKKVISENLKRFLSEIIKLLGSLVSFGKVVYKTLSGLAQAFGGVEKALTFAIKAILIFMGIRLAYSFGAIIYQIVNTVAAFTALGNAALLAQLKIIAIPAAIAAAIGLVYLLLDDLVAYFQGRDSLFGRAMDQIKERFPKAFGFLKGMFDGFLEQINVLVKAFTTIWNWLQRLDYAVKEFLRPMVDLLNVALQGWKQLFTLIPGVMGRALSGTAGAIGSSPLGAGGMGNINSLLDKLAPPAMSTVNPMRGTSGSHIEMKPTIAVTVNGGLTNEQTGGVVADAVNKIFGDLLTESSLDFSRAIER
jgi:TP901 family phage tail tape measure protein